MPVVLQCRHCKNQKRLLEPQMVELVQRYGMLRRDSSPPADLLKELLASVVGQLPCEACGGLGATVEEDWSDDWSDEVLCEGCKKPIDPERLEVFPDTKLCPKCQAATDAGESPGQEVEYCSSCGGILKLTKRTGGGLAGYQMVCGDCGKRG